MKTKITVLQKEKIQMNRYIETGPEVFGGKGNSRINIYNNKPNEVHHEYNLEGQHDYQKLEDNSERIAQLKRDFTSGEPKDQEDDKIYEDQ